MKKFIYWVLISVIIIELFGAALAFFDIEPTGFKQYFSWEWKDPVNPYADRDTVVGVWHEPNDTWLQLGPCFSVPMQANRFGARDNQWDTTKPGNFFVGSSFVEGYGMETEKRFTDVFERLTSKEVFNCGMGGVYGPVQYFLTAKKFEPILKFDTCFVFLLLPKDDEYVHIPDSGRYRPYLTDTGISYTKSLREMPLKKSFRTTVQLFFLQYSYTYHLLIHFKNRNFLKSEVLKKQNPITPRKLRHIDRIITLFSTQFPHKQLYFVIFPSLNYEPVELIKRNEPNIKIIDLHNILNTRTDYLDCNLHWNSLGHEKVAKALYKSVYTLE